MRKIRFGIIGTGKIAEAVLEASMLEGRFEATSIYSRSIQKANEFADSYHIEFRYDSLISMYSSGNIDAVYIASPTSLHFEHANLAMDYGIHVLCEKPLVSNSREAKLLVEKSKEKNVSLMEAMRSLLAPNYIQVKNNLEKIGKVRHYFGSYCQYSSRYDKLKNGIVENAFKPEFSNGATMDIGVYTLYPLIDLFGKPHAIKATGLMLATGVDGEATVVFSYTDFTATVVYSKITNSTLPSEIQGESGNILIKPIHSMEEVVLIDKKGNSVKLDQLQKNAYFYEIKEFIDIINKGDLESDILKHSNSIAVLEVMDEIRKQLAVKFPADKY